MAYTCSLAGSLAPGGPISRRLPIPARSVQRAAEPSAAQRFPADYAEAMRIASAATQAAIAEGARLLEVEFPTSSLEGVAGDAEGANEMTMGMRYLRQFCRAFQQQAEAVRIFFPDEQEMKFAQRGAGKNPAAGSWDVEPAFASTRFQLDYLTRPTGLLDIGIDITKVDVRSRCRGTDRLYIAAYPHFNVNEIIAISELYESFAKAGDQPIICFNGELDRLRSGYYPSLFFPRLGRLAKNFIPRFETSFYIHNFKGTKGGALFRVYPGPWQVLRRCVKERTLTLVHTQQDMPSLKEVALEILPRAGK